MQFNQKALDAKMNHLDEIKKHPEFIQKVVSKNLGDDFQLEEMPRRWVGGGATSYMITSGDKKYFLKIKHKDATVESKIEEEEQFSDESCVYHEYRMLTKAKQEGVSVPKVIFFDEHRDFQFLATEYIEYSLEEKLENDSLDELMALWNSLVENVRKLFTAGMVHSDVHEYNIRCSSPVDIVLIDLEECREFKQNCSFENSLDYTGTNGISSLGDFPKCHEQPYDIHVNCLARMRQLFKSYVAKAAEKYIEECNYDYSNGISITIDHGKSDKTYQSIKNSYFEVSGQRTVEDKRPELIAKLVNALFEKEQFTFIDVGSNNGLFGREIFKRTSGNYRYIGLEGFPKFNALARSLAFLDDCSNTEYHDFLCGEDDLATLNVDTKCFFTICSVWHHIQNKSVFLEQMNKLDVSYVLLEMAVQEECYGRFWEEELQWIKDSLCFQDQILLGNSEDYNRPLILIAKNTFSSRQIKRVQKICKAVYRKGLIRRIKEWLK